MRNNNPFFRIYKHLYRRFGPQHWWPGDTPLEIIVGAILTQNTAWTNVEKAIANLKQAGALRSVASMRKLSHRRLAALIRPAGYYNVKALRIHNCMAFLEKHPLQSSQGAGKSRTALVVTGLRGASRPGAGLDPCLHREFGIRRQGERAAEPEQNFPAGGKFCVPERPCNHQGGSDSCRSAVKSLREGLLSVNGIGPETADSILLYAFGLPVFVVDAYTRRIFSRCGLIRGDESYETIRQLFESRMPRSRRLFNEYHALIVRLGKEHCRPKPRCDGCPIGQECVTKIGARP